MILPWTTNQNSSRLKMLIKLCEWNSSTPKRIAKITVFKCHLSLSHQHLCYSAPGNFSKPDFISGDKILVLSIIDSEQWLPWWSDCSTDTQIVMYYISMYIYLMFRLIWYTSNAYIWLWIESQTTMTTIFIQRDHVSNTRIQDASMMLSEPIHDFEGCSNNFVKWFIGNCIKSIWNYSVAK